MSLTIVIPYYNGREALRRLLPTLPKDVPVIVVDDQSETPPKTSGFDVKLIRPEKRGYFAGAVNVGITACETDVLVLNQDIWFEGNDWLPKLLELRGRYAMIGDGVMNHPAWPKGYIQGTFMFMRRDAIKAVGGLNKVDFPLWGCTCEWQLRACRKGFEVLPLVNCDWFRHEERKRFGAAITQALNAEGEKASLFIRTPPLISVLVPCYNYGRFLPDALGSLIGGKTCLGEMPGQTFQGFEVIVVDDASTDKTPEIMARVVNPWKGIRGFTHVNNAGTAAALNTAAKAAFGRFLMVLSADDMLEPDALDHMYRSLEKDEHGLVYTDLQLFGKGKRKDVWKSKDYDFETLLVRNHVPAGIMFPKAAWKAAGGWPDFAHGREDWAMAVALGQAGYCGRHLAEPLYLYRRQGENRTLRNSDNAWRAHFVQAMRDTFQKLYGGERPMGCCGGGTKKKPPVKGGGAPKGVNMLAKAQIELGTEGMTMVEYISANDGRVDIFGLVTKTHYKFSKTRKIGYVDNRDLAGILAVRENKKPVFRMYVKPRPVVVPEPAPPPAPMPLPPVIVAPAPDLVGGGHEEALSESISVPVETVIIVPLEDEKVVLTERPKRKRGRPRQAAKEVAEIHE